MTSPDPKLSVKLSLSSTTYHFTNPVAPTLSLTIKSHADRPLTIFTWATPLYPKLGMVQNCFSVTDTVSNTRVPQSSIMMQRQPFSRVRGSGDERFFLELYPNTPVVVSTAFARGETIPPEPRAVVERGWERDKDGREMKIRRSKSGCGVDGLEGGHRYRVDVVRSSLMGVTWWWGAKDEVLINRMGPDWGILPGESTPLNVGRIEGVNFSVEWSEESASNRIFQSEDRK